MVQVPLAVLSKWNSIFCKDNEMYIVENPSVFAGLCAGHTKQVSCMCMNGQPRLAGLVTLDLLAASGTVVYYAGDLDPEGLLIAQKISEYYAGEFHYWHMTVEDYEKSKSNETISDKKSGTHHGYRVISGGRKNAPGPAGRISGKNRNKIEASGIMVEAQHHKLITTY